MKLCPNCTSGYHDSHVTCPTHGGVLSEIRELKPGMIVHKTYKIVRKLGEGGMGTVYLADHLFMEEQRALKFLAADLSQDEALTARFRREVRTLRQIHHKNVVDCGDLEPAEDDSLFFAMEFVAGADLHDFLRDHPKPMPVELALSIARGIAEGLGAAHALGMVHRDIKPENVLISNPGSSCVPKIADFGIVATKESSTRYTRTGGTLLTMAYAAPEQWAGMAAKDLDGRTDLYALGGVLFQMLTGQTVFDADSYEGWSERHRNSVPAPPSSLRPELSDWRGLDTMVLRLLAKDRNQRPQDAGEVLRLIDAVKYHAPEIDRTTALEGALPSKTLTDGTGTAKSESKKRLLTASLSASGVLAFVAIAFGLWTHSHQSEHSPQPESPVAQGPISAPKETQSAPQTSQPKQAERTTSSKPEAAGSQPPPSVPVEAPKQIAQGPSLAEIEKQAGVLYDQKRYADAVPLYEQTCAGGLGTGCNRLGGMYERGDGVGRDYPRAIELYSKACIAGITNGCDALILIYRRGLVTTQDASKAETLFSASCGSGNPHGCEALGFMYEGGVGVAKDESQAANLYSKACDGGDARGCLNLGSMYAAGRGVPRDDSRAAQLSLKGCEGGEPLACANLGYGYETGRGVPKDFSRAATYYAKGCDGGSPIACGDLGVLYENGSGVTKDSARADTFLSKSCDGGYALACLNLGIVVQNGNGAPKDAARASTLYSKACDGGYVHGCFNLGLMYEKGSGVAQDYSRAAALFSKACDAADAASCAELGTIYANGNGVARDLARAATAFSKSCDGGDARGCAYLGSLNELGEGTTKDLGKARQLYDKSCSMGSQWGCDQLKRMH